MSHFYTTRELQTVLQVDRTTIYRMADAGRIPAVKVGNQWRFPRQAVERWLTTDAGSLNGGDRLAPATRSPQVGDVRTLFPQECVQQIQDVLADALGVMLLITDLDGNPLTKPSHPCGLYTALEGYAVAQQRCVALWARLAHAPGLNPEWVASHTGLLVARALIRVGTQLGAMLIAGGIAPVDWPPAPAQRDRLAAELGLDRQTLDRHIEDVFHLSEQEQARVLSFVQRLADVVAHVLGERQSLFAKLDDIAALTRLEPAQGIAVKEALR